MPYYGPTTQYQYLTNFMKKEGRTYGDFKGLFGFNPLKDGIEYKMIQACTKIIYEHAKEIASDNAMDISGISDNIVKNVFMHFYVNRAIVEIVNEDGNTKYNVSYDFSTEHYPAITVNSGDKFWHLTKKLEIGTDDELNDAIADIIPNLVSFLSSTLWNMYDVDHGKVNKVEVNDNSVRKFYGVNHGND